MTNYVNNYIEDVSLDAGVTGINLALPDGDYLLTLTDSKTNSTRWEIVQAVVVGGTASLVRAQEGTDDQVWPIGSVIYCSVTAGGLAALGQGFSGDYNDLSNKPFIPAAPGDIDAATAEQGELADSAVQPAALISALGDKVDKEPGYGLSQENYTSEEKAKLAGLEGAHFKGTFTNISALNTAHPSASPGDYADVDAGASDPVLRYIWDDSDTEWVAQAGSADPVTAAQVKTLYESNPDTNAFTDTEKTKLGGVANGATANADTDSLSEGSTNLYHTAARVRAVVLTGLSTASSAAITATDTVLGALGKLAARLESAFSRANHTGTQAISTVSGLESALAAKQDTLVSATNIKTVNGESLLGGGDLVVSGGAAGGSVVTLTSSGGVLDLSGQAADVDTYHVTLTENISSITMPAAVPDKRIDALIRFAQDGTGGRTVSLSGISWDSGGTAPTVSATAGAVTWITAVNSDETGWEGFQ